MQGAWYNFEHKNINGRCVHIMIFIETALAIEAAPVIEHFKLKKRYVCACLPCYRNAGLALIAGGLGKVKSAMAAVYEFATPYEGHLLNAAKVRYSPIL